MVRFARGNSLEGLSQKDESSSERGYSFRIAFGVRFEHNFIFCTMNEKLDFPYEFLPNPNEKPRNIFTT